jgi:co-chaperonin GroES (HSP10)
MSNQSNVVQSNSKRVKQTLGRRLLVQHLPVARQSLIALPDATMQKSFIAVIKQVGEDVKDKITLQKDTIVLINSYDKKEKGTRPGEWFVSEDAIYLIKRGKFYHPYGRRVLLNRFNEELKFGSLIIPSCNDSSDQTLFGVVQAKGIVNGNIISDLVFEVGDIVKIEKWNTAIREVEIDDQACLSVLVRDIQYKCSRETLADNFVQNT